MATLKDKTAFISGGVRSSTAGTSGIGLATATLFLSEGARVTITGTNEAKLQQAKNDLNCSAASLSNILALRMDVRSSKDIRDAVAAAEAEFGKIDLLFVNAGMATHPTPITAFAEADFDAVMNVDAKGAFFTLQAAIPAMADGGSVIFNASAAHRLSVPGWSVLAAAKAAVASIARSAASELASRNIRVNVVNPGFIDTPAMHRMPEALEALRKLAAGSTLLRRPGTAEEVARAALFLASDEASSFMTGAEIAVDGGLLAAAGL